MDKKHQPSEDSSLPDLCGALCGGLSREVWYGRQQVEDCALELLKFYQQSLYAAQPSGPP